MPVSATCRLPHAPCAAVRRSTWLLVWLGFLTILGSSGLARENSPGRIIFDLPAGAAERTLKQFSERAGREVLFASDAVVDVRTNSVRGEFTPREAIERMLAGTKLTAVHEMKTGAIRVMSVAHANGKAGAAAAPPNPSPVTKKKASKP